MRWPPRLVSWAICDADQHRRVERAERVLVDHRDLVAAQGVAPSAGELQQVDPVEQDLAVSFAVSGSRPMIAIDALSTCRSRTRRPGPSSRRANARSDTLSTIVDVAVARWGRRSERSLTSSRARGGSGRGVRVGQHEPVGASSAALTGAQPLTAGCRPARRARRAMPAAVRAPQGLLVGLDVDAL